MHVNGLMLKRLVTNRNWKTQKHGEHEMILVMKDTKPG